ncbi:MAG TPA: TonB-dependent receptor plug domain-containing protein [Bacteroidales bacterium]|nr:TonB-dependent receptor plug domain-containing protein [Bacteroidales bacterium]
MAFREKVYLHVDRDIYFPGDDIWFKAYLVNASDNRLTSHSMNLHIEMISPSSEIIASKIIRIEGGLGNGDFSLPYDAGSGFYRLRAYTNYMRNMKDPQFFIKEIEIINGNENKAVPGIKMKFVQGANQLRFFPEGGSLVDSVPSVVSFKAVDEHGKGCDISGKVFSSSGELITLIRSVHLGMGFFQLTPVPGISYYCLYRGPDGIEKRAEIPQSFHEGITLSALHRRDSDLIVTVRANASTLRLLSGRNISLILSYHNIVLDTINYNIASPVTSFLIPLSGLPEGVIRLTLLTTEDLPFAERLVYIEKRKPQQIKIETDKLLYKTREPVNMHISLHEDSSNNETINMSLSVVDEKLSDKTSGHPTTITSWFLLESDVHGEVEEPSYYFDPSEPGRLRDLDLLLCTQGWRDFSWKYDSIYFPVEHGFTLSGSLKKYYKDKPLKDSRVSIGLFGDQNIFMTTIATNPEGRFILPGLDFTGEARLIISGIDRKDRYEGKVYLDSVCYNPPAVSGEVNIFYVKNDENKADEIKSFYVLNEMQKQKFRLADTIKLGEVTVISKPKDPQTLKIESARSLYMKPDAELVLTEQMESYPNVFELMRGRFPGVIVRGPDLDGNYLIYVRGISSLKAGSQPAIFIDGIHARFDELQYFPVQMIERIDIIKSVASTVILGMSAANGAINLITKTGGWEALHRNVTYTSTRNIKGYDEARIFYSPDHADDSGTGYKPDQRYTLLWKPYISLANDRDTTIVFYNGDIDSGIIICAEGLDSEGIPVTGRARYEVKK